MTTAYHTVHYRRFEVTSDHDAIAPLDSLCRAALSKANPSGIMLWERAEDRLCDLGDNFGGQVLLNRVADLQDSVFGELCYVERKGLQALLRLKASKEQLSNLTLAEVFALEERAAPNGAQFIRGLGYWLSTANHVFFVKTQAMTSDRLHAYFNWLLKDASRVVPVDLTFNLQAEFDRSIADLGDIRKLRVTGRKSPPVAVAIEAPGEGETKKARETKRKVREAEFANEQAQPIWAAIIGDEKTQSFVDALGPGEYITADTLLGVKGPRTEQTKERLKAVANELADAVGSKVQVEGSEGRMSEGDAILRTTMPFEVVHDGSRLLDFHNVADQLMEVYSRFVKDGKIDA